MTTAQRTIRATAGAQYAYELGTTYGPQICGKDAHLVLSRTSKFEYSAAFKFDLGASVWADMLDVQKVVLRFTSVESAHSTPTIAKSGFLLRRLKKAFEDNERPEGDWEVPTKTAVTHYPTSDGSEKAGVIGTNTGIEVVTEIDVTDWARYWCPTNKKVGGKPGLGVTHYGIWAVRRLYTGQKESAINWGGGDHEDDIVRPTLVFTYTAGDPKGAVTIDGPESPVPWVNGEYLTGTYIPGVEGALLSRIHIRLYAWQPDNTWGHVAWENGSTGELVTPSESVSGQWAYPMVGSTAHRIPLGSLLVSGKRYAWEARALSTKGVWSDFCPLTEINLNADAPIFEQQDLLPNARPDGSSYSPPTMQTLLNVSFGVRFRQTGVNLTHPLSSYRIQVRTETDPADPDWDGVALAWDSGETLGSALRWRRWLPGEFLWRDAWTTPYKGSALPAGTYSYRAKVTNSAGVSSAWRYGTFTLTKGQEPDPADNDAYLSGYARRQPKVRIRLRSIDANPQAVLVNATGGYFRLSYDGHTTPELLATAAPLAAMMQTALRALPGVGDATTVARSGSAGKYVYTVTFAGSGSADIAMLRWVKAAAGHDLSGGTKSVTVTTTGNRRPGRTVAVITDAAHIGASEYYNSPGEFYFTLPHTHPQISAIDPWTTHYALEFHRGNGWEEVASGIIHDFDANENDVVFYGMDYLGVLGAMIDERFNPKSSPKAKAYLYGETIPPDKKDGSYYENRTIQQIVTDQIDRAIHGKNSPLAFFTRGPVAAMTENVIIYCTFKPRLQFITGLLESWKGKTADSKRTRIRARHTVDGGYEFRVDDNPGQNRPNLRFEYGGLVNGFRIIPYGQWGTKVYALGREISSSELQYTTALTPTPVGEGEDYNENRYGSWPTTNLWQDITDLADLSRRARQFARSLGRVGKQVALGIRVDAMMLKDGWDITDSVPVHIVRGVIDTTRFAPTADGESYWTIWGWVFKVSPDGHTDLTLSILPQENAVAAADDITVSGPILKNLNEWTLADADPTPDDGDGSAKRWTNTQTGETFALDPETGLWVSISAGPGKMPGGPRLLSEGGVTTGYIAGKAVQSDKIDDKAVKTVNIDDKAVKTANIDDKAVTSGQLGDGAAIDRVIPDGVIGLTKFAASLRPVQVVTFPIALPNALYPADSVVVNSTDHKLYRSTGSAWTAAVPGEDIVQFADWIIAGAISAGAIGAREIAATAISVQHLMIGGPMFLSNSGFEQSLTGTWDQGGDGATGSMCYTEDGAAHSWTGFEGQNVCIIYTGAAGSWRYVRAPDDQLQSVSVGEYINISCLAGGVTPISMRIGIDCFNAAGSNFSSPYQTFTVAASRTMGRYRARIQVPAGTVKARVFIGNATTNAYLAIDDVWWSRGGVLADASGITIYDGSLTFVDSFGQTVLSGAGFGAPWQDFVQHQVANALLSEGTAGALTLGANYTDAAGRTSKLPYWTLYKTGAGTQSASYVASASYPGGGVVRLVAGGQTTGLMSDKFAVTPGRAYAALLVYGTPSGTPGCRVGIAWFNKSNALVSSTYYDATTTAGLTAVSQRAFLPAPIAPLTARWGRVWVEAYGTGTLDVGALMPSQAAEVFDVAGTQSMGDVDATSLRSWGIVTAQSIVASDGSAPGVVHGGHQLHYAPAMYRQSEAAKTLTTSVVAVTGCSTGALSVPINEYWIVDLVCDFSGTAGTTKAVCVGQLYLDGVALGTPTYGQALWQAPVGGGEARGAAYQTFVIPLANGTHTLDLRVSKSANYGTFYSQQYHTGFRLLRLAQ